MSGMSMTASNKNNGLGYLKKYILIKAHDGSDWLGGVSCPSVLVRM